MADDDSSSPAGKKKNVRNAAIVGVVALGAGLLWFVTHRGQASAANTSASTGGTSAASPGTDMGDIVQTVQGPPGAAGPAGTAGAPGARGPRGPAGKSAAPVKKATGPARRPVRHRKAA